jgi:hypothetical protein
MPVPSQGHYGFHSFPFVDILKRQTSRFHYGSTESNDEMFRTQQIKVITTFYELHPPCYLTFFATKLSDINSFLKRISGYCV